MKQRLLAGLLAVVLVLGLAPAALAAAPAEGEAARCWPPWTLWWATRAAT